MPFRVLLAAFLREKPSSLWAKVVVGFASVYGWRQAPEPRYSTALSGPSRRAARWRRTSR
jgi:hypothetical protein